MNQWTINIIFSSILSICQIQISSTNIRPIYLTAYFVSPLVCREGNFGIQKTNSGFLHGTLSLAVFHIATLHAMMVWWMVSPSFVFWAKNLILSLITFSQTSHLIHSPNTLVFNISPSISGSFYSSFKSYPSSNHFSRFLLLTVQSKLLLTLAWSTVDSWTNWIWTVWAWIFFQ